MVAAAFAVISRGQCDLLFQLSVCSRSVARDAALALGCFALNRSAGARKNLPSIRVYYKQLSAKCSIKNRTIKLFEIEIR